MKCWKKTYSRVLLKDVSKPTCGRQGQNVTSKECLFHSLSVCNTGLLCLYPTLFPWAQPLCAWSQKSPATDFPIATGSHPPPNSICECVCLITSSLKAFEGNIYLMLIKTLILNTISVTYPFFKLGTARFILQMRKQTQRLRNLPKVAEQVCIRAIY